MRVSIVVAGLSYLNWVCASDVQRGVGDVDPIWWQCFTVHGEPVIEPHTILVPVSPFTPTTVQPSGVQVPSIGMD